MDDNFKTERVFGIGKYRAFTKDHMRPLKGRALSCLGALGGSQDDILLKVGRIMGSNQKV